MLNGMDEGRWRTFGVLLWITVRFREKMHFRDTGTLSRKTFRKDALLGLRRTRHNCDVAIKVQRTQLGVQRGTLHCVFKVWVRHVCCIIFDAYRICYLLKCCTVIVAIYVHFTLVLFFQCDIIFVINFTPIHAFRLLYYTYL